MNTQNQPSPKSPPPPPPPIVPTAIEPDPTPVSLPRSQPKFDQSLTLQQSPNWSRAILWVLLGSLTLGALWAYFAKIEEAVQAEGKLEPQGAVKAVQAPTSGVVKTIHVKDGQQVKQGDLLISFDPTTNQAQLAALKQVQLSLIQENRFYQSQLQNPLSPSELEAALTKLKLPPDLITLTQNRAVLVAENQLYQAQYNGSRQGLTNEQQNRLQFNQTELNSRVVAAQLEVAQLTRQLEQARIRLANARETTQINQKILDRIEPVAKEGAISEVQLLQQQQQVEAGKAQIAQLIQEQARLESAIAAGKEKVRSTVFLSRKDWLTEISNNTKRISEIDSQLMKAILENKKRISEISSQLSQAQTSLKYQKLFAPTAGTVFDLQARAPGFVANPSEAILKIVPNDALIAQIFITNRDIGFVKQNMDVDIRIDSFPFSEFGDLKGKLIWIGSDTLPPDQIHPYYRFPAKIKLEQQSLVIRGQTVPLQSGMSVTTNIKIRERRVINIFTDLFTNSVESFKYVR